ncbi:MFS transporter [Bacillus sp. CGMCC 1.16541]|uniref:MFS transporter n=1 Tax=Bacillus sp. CGMCC 1.16541 TaxID=2185143 RepID=UPI000D73A400|nr:MFS transporter [Bacillus sp. CGMCC 1.16541]
MKELQNKTGPLILLMVNMFIVMTGIGLIIPIMPAYIEEFGASGQTLGLLVAAFGLTQFLFSPLAGELSDKYGRRLIIIGGIAGFSLSQIIFAFGTEMWHLYVSRLIGGASAAFIIPPMMAYVADITTEEKRGKGMGLLGAAMSLGFVIGPGIGGFLAEFGTRAPFYVSSAVAAFSTVMSILFIPETLSKEQQLSARQSNKKRESIGKQIVRSTKAPYAVLLYLVFAMSFGLANFEAIFGLYVDLKHNFTAKDIAIVITVTSLIGVFIQGIAVNAMINKFGEKVVVYVTLLGSSLGFILAILAGSYIGVFVTTVLFFIMTSLLRPAVNTLLSKMAGNEQGFVAGMNNAYMSLGNIAGPALAGVLFDVNVEFPYMLGALVLLLSFGLAYSWGRKREEVKVNAT